MNINGWVLFGFLGQAAFSARFLVQWIVSEKKKESTIPIVFWYLSLVGGFILFIYALHQRDLVFSVGQGSGVVVYLRNLILIQRKKRDQAAQTSISS